jgi:hypothetical protein
VSDARTAWTRALDDVEARVEACRVLLAAPADALPDVPPFAVPADLPPLPADLADRARAAALATGEVERALLARRDQARQELALLDGVRPPAVHVLDARG